MRQETIGQETIGQETIGQETMGIERETVRIGKEPIERETRRWGTD
jgi:hypothetical protein